MPPPDPSESPNRLRDAERAFHSFRRRRADGEALDFEAFVAAHAGLEDDLRFLHSAFVLGRTASEEVSFRDILGERIGEEAARRLWFEPESPSSDSTGTHAFPGETGARETGAGAAGELVGQLVRQRYLVEKEIARGGMSRIYRVRDRDLSRTLAMKVAVTADGETTRHHRSASSREAIARLVDEANITAQLDHPGIVPVQDVGFDDHGRVYFTMRLVKGTDLRAVIDLARDGRDGWTRRRVVELLVRICETVAYAHAKGIVHRDLKPGNIMVGRLGETYVVDWGLAKVLGREDRHETRLRFESVMTLSTVRSRRAGDGPEDALATPNGTVVGTPAYMPPEQAEGRVDEVNQRTDVYAIGAILYTLLVGRPPYVSADGKATALSILGKVIEGPPEPVLGLAPDAPRDLTAVCERAMARSPEDRHRDSLDLANELRRHLDGGAASVTGGRIFGGKTRRFGFSAIDFAVFAVAAVLILVFFARSDDGHERVLADLQRLADLEREASELWPADSRRIDALESWLRRAREWLPLTAVHRARLDAFEGDEESVELTGDLQRLVAGLERFDATVESIQRRLETARLLKKRTVDDVWGRWSDAIDEIRDADACPVFGGLDLDPQVGLIPIRSAFADSATCLWDFALWASGRIETGGALVDAESALVLALVPGDLESGIEPFFISRYPITAGQWLRAGGETREPLDASMRSPGTAECERVLARLGLRLPSPEELRHVRSLAEELGLRRDIIVAALEGQTILPLRPISRP